jgi:hypothetical protein
MPTFDAHVRPADLRAAGSAFAMVLIQWKTKFLCGLTMLFYNATPVTFHSTTRLL